MKHKMKLAPRNQFVAPAKFRKAGAHGKSAKATRRADKIQLQREYGVTAAQHPFKVPGQGSSPCAPTMTPFAWPLPQWPAEWLFFPGSSVGRVRGVRRDVVRSIRTWGATNFSHWANWQVTWFGARRISVRVGGARPESKRQLKTCLARLTPLRGGDNAPSCAGWLPDE